MSRLENTFSSLSAQGRKALVTFMMAGDPDVKTSQSVLNGLPASGADIIEIGMPFTDPAADGLTIQQAGLRALAAGMNLRGVLRMVEAFRAQNDTTPIVLMGYVNPVFSYGYADFARDAAKAGVDALIIVDLPPEEDAPLRGEAAKRGIDMIRLITPTTDAARLERVLDGAGGFLYYVSVTGVTGAAKASPDSLRAHLEMILGKAKIPVVVGFGIKTPKDAQEMSKIADGVVVGSAIVEKIKDIKPDAPDYDSVFAYISALSGALSACGDIDSGAKSGTV